MNIKQAKTEIENTIRCYLEKDKTGAYEIPVEQQRPILLIGPPGIGKTAIMEQASEDMGINLVSYTITHHTRQSAIGLPFISKRNYGGKEYSVTKYTMSEIIASIYDQIELSGVKEGILFLDEINCVSETLAPTMLQFLQYKTFGTHHVPEGFVIVTAGNPPQYNKSVRDFDIVTLDRVKKIDVEENLDVWKEYAYKAGVHGSVMSYLDIRKNHFYSIRTEAEARYFVTARGWEDLSRIIYVYEKLGIKVTKDLVIQYVQDPDIATDFATYYELYNKYRKTYNVPDILKGKFYDSADADARALRLSEAPFDEKLSILGLLIDSLNQEFREYADDQAVQKLLYVELGKVKAGMNNKDASVCSVSGSCVAGSAINGRNTNSTAATDGSNTNRISAASDSRDTNNSTAPDSRNTNSSAATDGSNTNRISAASDSSDTNRISAADWTDAFFDANANAAPVGISGIIRRAADDFRSSCRSRSEAKLISRDDERVMRRASAALDELASELIIKKAGNDGDTSSETGAYSQTGGTATVGDNSGFAPVSEWFRKREKERLDNAKAAGEHLTNSFDFIARTFGESQEMVLFLSELTAGYYSLKFVNECGNDEYYRYNKLLLLDDRRSKLVNEINSYKL